MLNDSIIKMYSAIQTQPIGENEGSVTLSVAQLYLRVTI